MKNKYYLFLILFIFIYFFTLFLILIKYKLYIYNVTNSTVVQPPVQPLNRKSVTFFILF